MVVERSRQARAIGGQLPGDVEPIITGLGMNYHAESAAELAAWFADDVQGGAPAQTRALAAQMLASMGTEMPKLARFTDGPGLAKNLAEPAFREFRHQLLYALSTLNEPHGLPEITAVGLDEIASQPGLCTHFLSMTVYALANLATEDAWQALSTVWKAADGPGATC
jgi:hypothetical protein